MDFGGVVMGAAGTISCPELVLGFNTFYTGFGQAVRSMSARHIGRANGTGLFCSTLQMLI